MPARRADLIAATSVAAQFGGAGTNWPVETPAGHLYLVYVDVNNDVVFVKSTDGGWTWSAPTVVFAGTVTNLSIWYDRWSGINGGLIHCAYTESGGHDTLYRSIDTESADALGTQTTIFAGTSVASGGQLTITRARGGNLYCRTCIDAGAEGGFFRSTDVGANWGSRTINEALATTDQMILMPGFAADDQDIIGIFWDASANEISRQLYDNSANSWAETSIATSMTDTVAAGGHFPHFDAFVDLENSRVVTSAWSAVDAANADLRCWTVTESAITETTANIVLNSVDDQMLCNICKNLASGEWIAFYCGKSDGSETVGASVNVYSKRSGDGGATWSSEAQISNMPVNAKWLGAVPRHRRSTPVFYYNDVTTDEIRVSLPTAQPRVTAGAC